MKKFLSFIYVVENNCEAIEPNFNSWS